MRGSAAEGGQSDVATLVATLLQTAERRIRIATAYFVPSADLMERICATRARAVEVEILLPGPYSDKRFVQLAAEAEYGTLLDAGGKLWTFQPSMLHMKMMTVDGVLANIGSANLNSRSMALDDEINLAVLDEQLVHTLDAHFDEDLDRSVRIERARRHRRSVVQQVNELLIAPARRLF